MSEEEKVVRQLAKVFFELDKAMEEVYRIIYENAKNGQSKRYTLDRLEKIANLSRELGAGMNHLDFRKPEPIKHRKRPEGQWRYLEQ